MSRTAPSSNFQDPVGLLFRMLKSGNRAAYGALFREGLRLGAIPFDAVLSRFERRHVAKNVEAKHPQVLIVGAPRSGTTLVYQALAFYLDVSSPSNLSGLFPRSPLTASRVQNALPSLRRPDFRNYYGQTTHLRGPNDAFHIWDRWLGEDRYEPAQSLTPETVADMQAFFAAWSHDFDKPFLNKNNRNTSCISLLAEHLPNAKFVVVRRNPLYVANSLIRARSQVQGDKSVGWGLQSASSDSSADPLAYVDDVCRQITSIDENIERQLSSVCDDRVVHVTYEDFCEHPQQAIRRIANSLDGVGLNAKAKLDELPPFQTSQQLTLTSEEQDRVQQYFSAAAQPVAT
ncbi:sulfotransferase family protein [Fuerstiella marisgermanici]|uniref:Sulfotransferase domain protein n=1 Tax=Fuerstiella marisgermanici TaxID=1891926 RepID=A0A1P8WNW3_9PLAN|nr:sulfotransferase [Fuerstiella marisgermanici]APZ95752.1 Sulfotransferase domain protein [Fuerstiella marisgermanici]